MDIRLALLARLREAARTSRILAVAGMVVAPLRRPRRVVLNILEMGRRRG